MYLIIHNYRIVYHFKSMNAELFIEWLRGEGIQVVVWDMDRTMSSGHCGTGLPLEKLSEYVQGCSVDFIATMRQMFIENQKLPGSFKLAVATGSDPLEYDLPGQSRASHILGPDLATEVIRTHCPEILPTFEIMIGYDCRLHHREVNETAEGQQLNVEGKRHHMRVIQDFYQVPFERMLLIDDANSSLVNEDGWKGWKVNGTLGFSFNDFLK